MRPGSVCEYGVWHIFTIPSKSNCINTRSSSNQFVSASTAKHITTSRSLCYPLLQALNLWIFDVYQLSVRRTQPLLAWLEQATLYLVECYSFYFLLFVSYMPYYSSRIPRSSLWNKQTIPNRLTHIYIQYIPCISNIIAQNKDNISQRPNMLNSTTSYRCSLTLEWCTTAFCGFLLEPSECWYPWAYGWPISAMLLSPGLTILSEFTVSCVLYFLVQSVQLYQ